MTSTVETSAAPGQRPGFWAWALLSPLLLWLLILVIAPTAIMVVFSFCGRTALGEVVYQFTTENYARVVDSHQAIGLLISIAVAAVATAVGWAVFSWHRFSTRDERRQASKTRVEHPRDESNAGGWLLAIFLSFFWPTLNAYVLRPQADLEAARWLKITVVSVNYAAFSTAVCVVMGYPVAYFIGRAPERWRNLLLMAVMVPFWTSFLVRTYAWVTILRTGGILESLLAWLHLYDGDLNLYPSQTGVMIGLIYTYLPFMILPIYTSVERLDNALVEAAFDLGAQPLRTFRSVILPLTKPGIIAGIVLVFVPAVGMFAVNDILGGHKEMLIGNVIQNQFTSGKDKPFGSALGMLLLAMFIATYALSLRRRNTGEA